MEGQAYLLSFRDSTDNRTCRVVAWICEFNSNVIQWTTICQTEIRYALNTYTIWYIIQLMLAFNGLNSPFPTYCNAKLANKKWIRVLWSIARYITSYSQGPRRNKSFYSCKFPITLLGKHRSLGLIVARTRASIDQWSTRFNPNEIALSFVPAALPIN